jgi:hypothetical protein
MLGTLHEYVPKQYTFLPSTFIKSIATMAIIETTKYKQAGAQIPVLSRNVIDITIISINILSIEFLNISLDYTMQLPVLQPPVGWG